MKKIQSLGRVLSKHDQKRILGGVENLATCSAQPTNCTQKCSCDTVGTNTCSSTANTATCDCDGIIVEITC